MKRKFRVTELCPMLEKGKIIATPDYTCFCMFLDIPMAFDDAIEFGWLEEVKEECLKDIFKDNICVRQAHPTEKNEPYILHMFQEGNKVDYKRMAELAKGYYLNVFDKARHDNMKFNEVERITHIRHAIKQS